MISAISVLTACGGGGSGDGGSVNIASTPVAITPANAETVAATSYEASVSLDQAGLGATSIVGAVTTTAGGSFDLTDFAFAQAQRAGRLFAQHSGALATGVVVSDSEPCASGSVSYTINDADDSNSLTTGDTFDLQFNNCSDGGTTINGGLSLSGVVVTGDIETPVAPYELQATFSFNNLTVNEAGETATIAGAITIILGSSDGITINSQLSGASILLTAGTELARLSNFSFDASENLNTGEYTISVNATVDNNTQGGRTTLTTITPFQGSGLNDPYAGEALITGANNCSVRLIVHDAINVELQIDEDGDGTPETFINTTWAQLNS